MTANNEQGIPANLVMFLEMVGSADLTSEEAVRSLLCQISLEALKGDLGFEMSIDQLVPFCLIGYSNYSLKDSQVRGFLIFFGRGDLSVEKLAPHLKNTVPAKVFYQKTAAIKKLREFVHTGSGKEKLVTISKLFRNSALVQKLRTLDIHGTEDLIKLTSAKFVEKLSRGGAFQYVSIQNIAKKLDAIGQHFADGKEATRSLMTYDPKSYKPSAETPAFVSPSQAPPGEAGTDPPATQLAVSEASPDAQAPENSLRATLKRFSGAFDFMTVNGGNPDKFEGEENFMAENEQEYLLSISITRKKSPA